MKIFLINYYAVIIMSLFIINNMILKDLKIGGLIYQFCMIIFIIFNSIILIKFRRNIKYKNWVIVVYFLIWLFSKNIFQCLFDISNIIILMIIGFSESKSIKAITILIILFFAVFQFPLLFIFLLAFGNDLNAEQGMNDIYEDTHYYCEKKYEIYSYSAGAMDGFHYSIGKHYEILNIDDIISISYNERNEKTKEDYDNFLNNHSCILIGD